MKTSRTTSSLFVAAALGLFLPATAGAAAPAPPAEPDALSRTTLARWALLEYRPSQAGLAGGSVELVFDVKSRGRTSKGKAAYTWDAATRNSSLAWTPASLGGQLSREGWSRDVLDHRFLASNDLDAFRGCTLTATSRGGQVVISVEGTTPSGIREMTFDDAGLLTRTRFETREGGFSLETTYRKHGARYVKSTETMRMKAGGGNVVSESTHTFAEVGGVLLPSKVVQASTWNGHASGSKTVTWTKWKIRQ